MPPSRTGTPAWQVDRLVLELARLAGAAAGLAFVAGTAVQRALEDETVADLTKVVEGQTALLAGLADRLAAGVLAFDDSGEGQEADGGDED